MDVYGEEVTATEGSKDFRVHNAEFAVTRVDGELKLIRYRAFVPNYYGLQTRVIENPGYIENLDSLRVYIDGAYPDEPALAR